jgi:hypothetical protein
MRTIQVVLLFFGLGLFSSRLAVEGQAQVQVNVTWTPSTSPNVAGYYLVWGTNSGVYLGTNTYPATQTNGTISNLQYGILYYIAASAYAANGQVSPFCSNLTFISNAPVVINNPAPPPPPLPGSQRGGTPATPQASGSGSGATAGGGSGSGGGSGGGATGGSGSGGGSSTGAAAASTNAVQAQIWGIPPLLNMTVSNGQPNLNIGGTVGATVQVQSTTNPAAPFSWTTITNVALTNVAPMDTNPVAGQPQDPIDLAYVPAAQSIALSGSNSAAQWQYYRVVMPYDYIILAGMVLPGQGYTARLILVNMPGLTDDACYVNQAGSFIHYTWTNSTLQLQGSGSTIRQIASTLAGSLNLDWTTASEFLYSNGVGQVLATVVQTDPASTDPVAGTAPTSTIAINF